MRREKKEGVALGAFWSLSQNLLEPFAESFSALFQLAIRWSCCRAGADLEMSSALCQDKTMQLLLPAGNLGIFEECSAALSP